MRRVMIDPTIILLLLLLPVFARHLFRLPGGLSHGALIGLSVGFVFFAVGHFVQTDGMRRMPPEWVPLRRFLIYATAALELAIAAAPGDQLPAGSRTASTAFGVHDLAYRDPLRFRSNLITF